MKSAGCAELVRLLAKPTKQCNGIAAGKNPTKVMRICALVITLAFAVSGQEIEDGDTWARLQIGSNVFTTLQYGDLVVKVYEQLSKPNATKRETTPWYYFMPVNLLLPESAECIYNKLTNRDELRFSIEFWNEDLRQRIVKHLRDSEGIENAKVAVIPFEQVILTTTEPSQFYRPTNSWVPYGGQKLMNFSLIVNTKTKCRELQDHTRSSPHDSHHFRLMFNVAATNARSRTALISVNSIRKGSLFSQLEQKFPNAGSVLLTADDTNRLLSESKAEIMVETFDDTEVPNPSSEARIYEMLDKLLIDSQETIKEQSSQMWSSVFYENENYRPDQVTQTVSDIYRRSDKEAQKTLSSLFSNSKSNNIDAALELIKHRLTSRADGDAESSSKSDRASDSSSKSRSDSSASSKQSQSQNRERQRSKNDHSLNYHADGNFLGLATIKADLDVDVNNDNERESERSGSNANSNEESSSRGTSESQEKAREEVRSLSRQRDRNDVSNDQLAEKLARASANSEEEKKEMQEIFKLLLEGKERVEWQGNKFQPKPMTLSRVNLAKVRSKTSFGSRDVKVTYSKATLTAGVNVASKNSLETMYWLAEMQKKQSDAFEKMDSKMKAINETLSRKLTNVENKFKEMDRRMKAMNETLNQHSKILRTTENAFKKMDSNVKAMNETLNQKIRNVESNLQIVIEADLRQLLQKQLVVSNKLETLESTTSNQSIATRSQLAEVERNLKIDREAVAVVADKLKNLGSTADNRWNATRSIVTGVSNKLKSLEGNLGEAVENVSKRINTFEVIFINQRNVSRSELAEVQRTCERNLKEAAADVNNKLNSLESQQKTEMECLKRSGPDSNCREFRDMGCYCIVEVKKDLNEATDYCRRINMNLVAIETQEKSEIIRGFLTDNLGSRGKYASSFMTSGYKSGGRWQWTSNRQPLVFLNWGKYYDNEKRNRLFISQEKPFTWYNEYWNNVYYFICESSAPQQEIKQLTAYDKSKICPPNIGTDTKCFANENFGCYCLGRVLLNVTEAARFCQSHAMQLLSIESYAEEQYLTRIIEATKFEKYNWTHWWTSGSDVEVENNWVWTATGQPVQYTNWNSGEPNNLNGKEHYIGIRVEGRTVKWFDFPAVGWGGDDYIKTICEY